VVSFEPPSNFLIGTVADPTKRSDSRVSVGRATPSISLRAVRLSNGVPAEKRTIGLRSQAMIGKTGINKAGIIGRRGENK
jgi:hypothetical protein